MDEQTLAAIVARADASDDCQAKADVQMLVDEVRIYRNRLLDVLREAHTPLSLVLAVCEDDENSALAPVLADGVKLTDALSGLRSADWLPPEDVPPVALLYHTAYHAKQRLLAWRLQTLRQYWPCRESRAFQVCPQCFTPGRHDCPLAPAGAIGE